MKLIAKYEAEQKELSTEVAGLEEKFTTIRQDEEDVEKIHRCAGAYP